MGLTHELKFVLNVQNTRLCVVDSEKVFFRQTHCFFRVLSIILVRHILIGSIQRSLSSEMTNWLAHVWIIYMTMYLYIPGERQKRNFYMHSFIRTFFATQITLLLFRWKWRKFREAPRRRKKYETKIQGNGTPSKNENKKRNAIRICLPAWEKEQCQLISFLPLLSPKWKVTRAQCVRTYVRT